MEITKDTKQQLQQTTETKHMWESRAVATEIVANSVRSQPHIL